MSFHASERKINLTVLEYDDCNYSYSQIYIFAVGQTSK